MIDGLPLHPLVVHVPVVLIPLAALGAIVVLVSRRARDRYGWLVVGVAAAAAVAGIAARLTGEVFLDASGAGGPAVDTHMMWGQVTPFAAVGLAIALPVALVLRDRSRFGWAIAAGVSVAAALASLVLVVLTGHSGATAVWGGLAG